MALDIHSSAIVHPEAQIGANAVIGPYTIIERGVVIGENTRIGSNVLIAAGAHIKNDCIISHGAVIGTQPQDLKFKGEHTIIEIGERTVIREYCMLNRGTAATGATRVGADCFLMAYSHVAHDCQIGNHVIIANGVQMGGHTHIGDWAILGGLVGIHQFSRIGAHTMVGAASYITKDIPPYALVGGIPPRCAGINVVGLRRRGFSSEAIDAIQRFYKILFNTGLNVADGIIKAESDLPPLHEIRHIIEFIRSSERGILRGR